MHRLIGQCIDIPVKLSIVFPLLNAPRVICANFVNVSYPEICALILGLGMCMTIFLYEKHMFNIIFYEENMFLKYFRKKNMLFYIKIKENIFLCKRSLKVFFFVYPFLNSLHVLLNNLAKKQKKILQKTVSPAMDTILYQI